MAGADVDGAGPFFGDWHMLRSGLIGRSVTASRSPWLHEQEAQAQGLRLSYELFDFTALGSPDKDLGNLIERLRGEGYRGVNITYPFKQAVIPLLDDLADSAASVGAVNTIEIRNGRTIGHNTDMTGFRESVTEGLPGVELGSVLQLGAGGAGAAVAIALLSLDVKKLLISDIDGDRAEVLALRLGARFGGDRVAAQPAASVDTTRIDGIVNASPMGMAANPAPPLSPDQIHARNWVADIVYFPLETELLRIARERGCRVLDGSGMVVNQAAAAFEIFTGAVANRDRMKRSFADYLQAAQSDAPSVG